MSFLSPNNKSAYIFFGDPDCDETGIITYGHSSDALDFYVNDGHAIRIDSSQEVGIGTTAPHAKLALWGGACLGLGIRNTDQSTIGTTPHIWLGSASAVGNVAGIAFGYDNGGNWNTQPPAYMGYCNLSAAGYTAGSLIFATRSVTTNTAPTTRMIIATDGSVTTPAQPSFKGQVSYGSQNNVSGDATQHTVIFDTECFDRGGDYNNATGIFTAPVTGLYQLNSTVQVAGTTTAMNDSIMHIAGDVSITIWSGSGTTVDYDAGFSASGSGLVDMDAGDTAKVVVDFRSGSKVVCVWTASQFSGHLVA